MKLLEALKMITCGPDVNVIHFKKVQGDPNCMESESVGVLLVPDHLVDSADGEWYEEAGRKEFSEAELRAEVTHISADICSRTIKDGVAVRRPVLEFTIEGGCHSDEA